MVNYQNAVVYAIRSHSDPELVYIGSTCNTLSRRMVQHRMAYNRYLKGTGNNVTSFKVLEAGEAYIELIEAYPCSSRMELNRREGQIMRETECVNKHIAGRTKQEHYQDNKDQINQKHREYYENNKEQRNQKCREYHAANKDQIKAKKAEYHAANKEQLNQKCREYRAANREQLAEKHAENFVCECGGKYTYAHKARHLKTTKHKTWVNAQH